MLNLFVPLTPSKVNVGTTIRCGRLAGGMVEEVEEEEEEEEIVVVWCGLGQH